MAGAALIAKAILGSIGGAFEGAARPYSNGNIGVKAESTGAEKVGKKRTDEKDVTFKESSLKNENLTDEKKSEALNSMDMEKAYSAFNKDGNKAFGLKANFGSVLNSDARLKEIYGDAISDRLIEDFAKISAIEFKYTPEAQKEYGKESGVDDKEHTGVIAQELADTESTKSAVEPDINGTLQVNTPQLTMTNTAVIAELSRRVLTLEAAVQELMSRIKGADNGQ
jgi:hypothetical protein